MYILLENIFIFVRKSKDMEDKKMTAVDWFTEEIDKLVPFINKEIAEAFIKLCEQTKEMEKEQIIEAYEEGYDDGYNNKPSKPTTHYNETYK